MLAEDGDGVDVVEIDDVDAGDVLAKVVAARLMEVAPVIISF